ncbi:MULTISPECIES: GNAT family N-acetyltransferase [Paenibacillus]|uniref:N-acetyltransferase n=2 Tax=Paenibacillus TaxID=44249 RepID=A0ABU3R5C1_9BACL|nr:N-acetyltransferase [Paenibacillus anseongense]MDU0199463.1 N-acetyltransferase [Paenibacillus sp. PFR10]MEC0267273.1 N-acetyltransferase [Paenibacillus anseongense]
MISTPDIIKQNMIHIMKQMSDSCPRMSFVETPQAIRYESDLPHSLFNRIITYKGLKSDGALNDIATIADHYQSSKRPFSWLIWSHDTEAVELASVLEEQGLKKSGQSPGMSLSLTDWTYEAPSIPNFEIKPIRTSSEFSWFKEIALPAFGLQGETGEVFMQVNESLALGEQAILRHFAGFLDGRPAGVVTAFQDGETIGIYNVATAGEYRRRGIGSALTAHAIREGQAAGGKLAVLQSSEMGVRVYRAMGFSEEVRIDFYMG